MKRGQITIFIIIAVVVIALTAIIFLSRDSFKIGGIPESIDPVYNEFQSCFEATSNEGVHYIASHGGYYDVPFETSIVYFTEDIPYYFLESKNYTPTIEIIEEELAKYISENLNSCFDLESYKTRGFEIENENYSILAKINEDNIEIKMLNKITVIKGEDKSRFNTKTNLDYNIKNLHEASVEIIKSYIENPGTICLTCLEEISEKNSVKILAVPHEDPSIYEDDIIWFLINDKEDTSEKKLNWIFIVEQ